MYGLVVFEAMAVDGSVGFVGVEVRRFQHHDLAPRVLISRGRDIGPVLFRRLA